MAPKEMQIFFDNTHSTYHAGSQVNGRLVLSIHSFKKVQDIKVKFKGVGKVAFSEAVTRRDEDKRLVNVQVDFKSEETYLEYNYLLCQEMVFQPGTHNFDFTATLPENLPTSYEGEFGHIRYTVKAILGQPWSVDEECMATFTVIRPLDLNLVPEARFPLLLEKEKTVGICCCASGPLSATLTAPRVGYTSGEVIPVSLEVENMTDTNVTPGSVKLRKIIEYKATKPDHKTRKSITDMAKFDLGAIGAHGSNTFNQGILIPPLPAANTQECSIININYELFVEIPVSGAFYSGLKFPAPIVIGTVPLMSVPNPGTAGEPQPHPPNGHPVDNSQYSYPNFPPPAPAPKYGANAYGQAANTQGHKNQNTVDNAGWGPHYPSYNNFSPSAPPC